MDALQACLQRCAENARANKPVAKIEYKCSICHDTEWIMYKDEKGNEICKPCQCREKNLALLRMAKSGISEDDLKKGFADFETFNESGLVYAKETALNYYKAFDSIIETRHNSLLLCGASGRGKTTLGMAVANNLIKQKSVGVRYMQYRDEVTRLKQEIIDEYNYNNHMYKLKTAKVLFIDDLLKGKVTESDVNIIYEIINYRYLERLPMIISTERTIPELLSFDEAIAGRIVEMCKGFVVTFDSSIPNYRMR